MRRARARHADVRRAPRSGADNRSRGDARTARDSRGFVPRPDPVVSGGLPGRPPRRTLLISLSPVQPQRPRDTQSENGLAPVTSLNARPGGRLLREEWEAHRRAVALSRRARRRYSVSASLSTGGGWALRTTK